MRLKFLGGMLYTKLSWKPHIWNIHSKVSKYLGNLHKVKFVLDKASLLS